jgi:hypothetical protein
MKNKNADHWRIRNKIKKGEPLDLWEFHYIENAMDCLASIRFIFFFTLGMGASIGAVIVSLIRNWHN